MFTVQYRPLFQARRRVKKAFKKVSPSLENWNISIYLCPHFSDMKDYKVVFLLCLSVSSIHQWDRITENQLPNSLGCRADKSDHDIKYSTAEILEYVCAVLFFFFAFLIGMKDGGGLSEIASFVESIGGKLISLEAS